MKTPKEWTVKQYRRELTCEEKEWIESIQQDAAKSEYERGIKDAVKVCEMIALAHSNPAMSQSARTCKKSILALLKRPVSNHVAKAQMSK